MLAKIAALEARIVALEKAQTAAVPTPPPPVPDVAPPPSPSASPEEKKNDATPPGPEVRT